jgi:signal transduction histidine kinase
MNRWTRFRNALDRNPTLTDAGIAAFACVFGILTLWAARSIEDIHWNVPAVLFVILGTAPLTWRRRYPLGVLVLLIAVLTISRLLGYQETEWTVNAAILALYSAGAYGAGRARELVRGGAVLIIFGLIIYDTVSQDLGELPGNELLLKVLSIVGSCIVIVVTWWFGDAVRVRRLREAQLAESVVQLERDRLENARRAVFDERVRIARELHDVVAHHVSVMGVQAGAARKVLATQPDKAQEALSNIEASSREAVREMHKLLGFLRQERDDDHLAPQPSMAQLDLLIGQMRDAGLPVELEVEGQERSLPPSVDLSAYRIVQEALTNTLRHAGPARATVKVTYGDRAVEIEVFDDGRGGSPNGHPESSGQGLIGMRERVALLGGQFEAGHHPGVGFSVRAHLPLDGVPA